MAELTFGCTGAHVVHHAATPTFALSLNISESTGIRLHAIALRCQVRIEPHRRRYTADEARRLNELFGDTRSWAESPRPLHLATLTTLVPAFTWRTEVDLQVPCSYDLEVASARYLQVIEDGTIPLLLLFSGTVFVDHGHTHSVELIPWSVEAPFPMPARVWHDVIEEHFPGSAWLRCGRKTLNALAEFKSANALPTWDATLSALLEAAHAPWDPGAPKDPAPVAPGWPDEVPEPEPETAAAEPQDATPEPRDAAPDPQDAPTEPPAAAPQPADTVPAPEDAAPPDAAPADPAPADPAPPDATPADATPADATPADATPADATPENTPPEDAAPAEAAQEERHAGTGRRRTGTAGRRPAVRRTGGRRAGGT